MFNGIKNLIKWRKVIWNDSDWDYEFLLIILETKLKFMAESFKSDNAFSVDSEIHGKEMEKCAEICRYLIDGKYDHFYDELDEKWGELEMIKDLTNNSITFEREKVKTKTDQLLFEKELQNATMKAEQEEQDKIHSLFSRIKNNLTKWWD
jgi:hypothetical protein